MERTWNEDQPIYRQLMSEIVGRILSGELSDGDALPSIRKIASQFQVNPLTASKACRELAIEKVIDKQRGVGLFVRQGARRMLLRREKEKFLSEELPEVIKRMKRLGFSREELLAALDADTS